MQRKCSKKDTKHSREKVEGPPPRGRDGKRLSLKQTAKRPVYKNKIHMVSTDRKKNRNLKETVIIRKKKLNEENKERIENETE